MRIERLCRPLKNFLVELALAWAARAHALELGGSGQWKLPRMRYKGDTVKPQRLRLQRNEPVSCLSLVCDCEMLWQRQCVAAV